MSEIVERYSNGEVIIIWQPSLCMHSGVCAEGLPRALHPQQRP